jgi:hypothetical protein
MMNAIRLSRHWILWHRQRRRRQLLKQDGAAVEDEETVARQQGWIRTIQH